MSDYSIVPNAALTATANAIRTKSGSQATIEFDHNTGFADAIDDIPSGISFSDYITGAYPAGKVVVTPTANIPKYGISGRTAITELTIDFAGTYWFADRENVEINSNLQRIIIKNHTASGHTALPDYAIAGNSSLTQIIIRNAISGIAQSGLRGNSALKIVDIENSTGGGLGNNCFYGNTVFDTVILRQSDSLCQVSSSTFLNTPFKSGGTGGTVYIPKTLYDKLGDGTSLDYKNATNWSVWDSYGTITWAKIEGSPYESLTWWEEN